MALRLAQRSFSVRRRIPGHVVPAARESDGSALRPLTLGGPHGFVTGRRAIQQSSAARTSADASGEACGGIARGLSKSGVSPEDGPLQDLQRSLATLDWTFSKHSEAYKSKTLAEVARAYVVFGLCGIEVLTRNNQTLMHVGRRTLGKTLFQKLMEATFYGHFVAGEHADAVRPMLERNLNYGVNAILYYSMEEDLRSTSDARSRPLVPSASAATAKYERNVQKFLHSVDVIADATGSRGGGCIAVKPSALASPELWLNLATIISRRNKVFDAAFGNIHDVNLPKINSLIFSKALPLLTPRASEILDQWMELFNLLDHKHRGWIHRYQFNDVLQIRRSTIPAAVRDIFPSIDEEIRQEAESLMDRAKQIVLHAKSRGVAVMVDAEQSYFQPAISRLLGVELMRNYNTERVVVYNTYQTYLKAARNHAQDDIALARSEGFCLGARVVRGAYLHQEREHARKSGSEDPTNETIESTTRMYHDVITYMLREAASVPDRVQVMAATHNEDSIKFVLNQLKDLNVPLACISFGQLYGMSDHLSFSLGQAGFRTFKSVPYGPVELVFSYLGRRALENADVFRKASKERWLLQKELAGRLRSQLGLSA